MGSEEAGGVAAFALFNLIFFVIWGGLMAAGITFLVLHIVALVDVAKMQGWQFVPPGEPVKSSWLLGLALAFVIPFGGIVTTIMWWRQVRAPKRMGQLAGRPFWMSDPSIQPPPPGWGPPPGVPAPPPPEQGRPQGPGA
jgi:hypothetical protein